MQTFLKTSCYVLLSFALASCSVQNDAEQFENEKQSLFALADNDAQLNREQVSELFEKTGQIQKEMNNGSRAEHNPRIARVIVEHTTADERIAAAHVLSQAAHLDAETSSNLIQIVSDEDAFIEDFHYILKDVDIPEITLQKERQQQERLLFISYDWGCRWLYDPSDGGTEVGIDFWWAAFLCAVAHEQTNVRSYLKIHQHNLTIPRLEYSHIVFTF